MNHLVTSSNSASPFCGSTDENNLEDIFTLDLSISDADPQFRSMLSPSFSTPISCLSLPQPLLHNPFQNSRKTNANPQTSITVPIRPRSLAPTVFLCASAFMEIYLSIEYFLDVICQASFRHQKDRCHVSLPFLF